MILGAICSFVGYLIEMEFEKFLIFYAEPGKTMKPLLVIDARSYTAAFANRAKGGGFEYQGMLFEFQ